MGFAVFFMNDFLWSEIVSMIESEKCEKLVPEAYRKYFYREVGKKMRNLFGSSDRLKPNVRQFVLSSFKVK